jgi:predicted MFS family arabinose efflux permease
LNTSSSPRIWREIGLLTAGRLFLVTSYRMVYPLLAVFAAALGMPLSAIAYIVTLRAVVGLAGPLMGVFADRFGLRLALVLGSGLYAAGMFLVVLMPNYTGLLLGLLLAAAAKVLYDPAAQAYIGDRVPYARRGQAIGIYQGSWSVAYLVGIPILVWLIDRAGWSAPFPWLGALGLLMVVLLWRGLKDKQQQSGDSDGFNLASLRMIYTNRQAMGMLGVAFLLAIASQNLFIVFGAWLFDDFNVQLLALGGLTAIFGLAELSGEGLVATFADRLGKRRATLYGLVCLCAGFLFLPLIGINLIGAVVGLILVFLSFEFSLVSAISVMTELGARARATYMAFAFAVLDLSHGISSLIGPRLYQNGIAYNGLVSGLLIAVAIYLMIRTNPDLIRRKIKNTP